MFTLRGGGGELPEIIHQHPLPLRMVSQQSLTINCIPQKYTAVDSHCEKISKTSIKLVVRIHLDEQMASMCNTSSILLGLKPENHIPYGTIFDKQNIPSEGSIILESIPTLPKIHTINETYFLIHYILCGSIFAENIPCMGQKEKLITF